MTFLAAFLDLVATRVRELATDFRAAFFGALEGAFPPFWVIRERLLEARDAFSVRFPAGLPDLLGAALRPFFDALPLRLGVPALLGAAAPTAPIAERIRLISRVTCSIVIMPSTVSSLRRSE